MSYPEGFCRHGYLYDEAVGYAPGDLCRMPGRCALCLRRLEGHAHEARVATRTVVSGTTISQSSGYSICCRCVRKFDTSWDPQRCAQYEQPKQEGVYR